MSSNISISPGTKVSQTTSPKKPNQSQETQQGEVREQQQEYISSEASNAYKNYNPQIISNESNVQEPATQETNQEPAVQEPATQNMGMTDEDIDEAKNVIKTRFLIDNKINPEYLNMYIKNLKNPNFKDKILKVLKAMSLYIRENNNIQNLNEVIDKLLDNNILTSLDDNTKAQYLTNISQAAANTKDLSSKTIKTLLNNKDNIHNENKRDEYLCNISQAASKSKNINPLDFIFLLNNLMIESIQNNENKAKYLYNISQAAANTKNLSSTIITLLLNNKDHIDNENKDEYLCNIAQAVSKMDGLNLDEKIIKELYTYINSIQDNDKQGKALYALLEATNKTASKTASKTLVNEAIKVFLKKCPNNTKVENIPIQLAFNKLISIVENNSFRFGSNKTIQNLVNIWDNIKFQDTTDNTTKGKINAKQYKNLCLAHIAHATAKSTSLNNDTMTILLNKIDDISSTKEKIKKQKQLAYIYTLSENLKINKKVNKDIIESLFNKALNYGMFEDDDTNTYMQRTFVRNLIDAISRLDQNEAKELYTQLYTTATTTKDNTNPVKENDGKNDIDGYSSENLSNNAQSSYMPPKLILFFAKLDKTLGYQQNTEIQNKLMDAITNTSLDEKENKIKLAPKVSLCPALNYLQEEQLKAIDESAIANRIIQENGAKDIRQFELEYLIDLKLSHGLYELNTDEGRNKFIEILTNNYNYDILTNKFEPKMKYETQTNQVNGDISDSNCKIDKNVEMVISDKNYDGVYNLALIALKQMEPENREEFLNKLIEKLDPKSKTTNLLEELKTNEQFDNDKLLDTKPVLRQYDDKSKTVSKNYQPNLTSFRMPRTTDKCEIFKENGTTYLGFKGTSQKIETKLDTKKAELLFGSQSSSGHQMIGNCWLIATLKQIEANPQLKLAVYSHFDATVDKNNELQSVTINLKDGRKVTFSKDVVDEVSKIGATEHLSPAMSCLALLSAIYRTTGKNGKHDISQINETINSSSLQEKFSESQYDTDSFDNVNESNKQITAKDPKNAIINALRISNEDGNEFNDILSLFIDDKQDNIKDDTQSNGVNTIQVIGLYKHAIGKYGDFYLNPQNSHSLSIFSKATDEDQKKAAPENSDQQKEIYVNKIYKKDDQSYTIPQFKAETIYSKIKKSVNNIVNSFIGFFKKDNTKTNLSVNG